MIRLVLQNNVEAEDLIFRTRQTLIKKTNQGAEIEFEIVESIASQRGKLNFVINELN